MKKDILINAVNSAEYILVGIGEEWQIERKDIEQTSVWQSFIKKTEKENLPIEKSWLLPYVENAAFTEIKNIELESAYKNLLQLVKNKNYFLVTTVIDDKIYESDFEREKIVAPCGGYHFLQCDTGCNEELICAEGIIKDIISQVKDKKILLVDIEKPICKLCKGDLIFNNIHAHSYVEKSYLEQWTHYTTWLQRTLNKKVCILELGVGLQYPTVIRWPFEKIGYLNQKADFFRVHHKLFQLSEELKNRGNAIYCNSMEFMRDL